MRSKIGIAAALAAVAAAALPAAQADDATNGVRTILFNGEGNNLDIYDVTDLDAVRQREMVPAFDSATGTGLDMNAQMCFSEVDGEIYFINGEDTGQSDGGTAGWGQFRLTGDTFDTLDVEQVGKLVPDWVDNQVSGEENYGCGFLADGNLVTSEVGDQYPLLPNTGELILWFVNPETGLFDQGYEVDENGYRFGTVPHCHLDRGVATAGGILIRTEDGEEVVYLASNRPGNDGETGGIFRYANLPSTPEECASGPVDKTLAIAAAPLTGITPSAVAEAPNGNLYMSSVFDGVISEWAEVDLPGLAGTPTKRWVWVRNIIDLPAGTPVPQLGDSGGFIHPALDTELTHGTPFGIGVGPDGTIFYADLGVTLAIPVPDAGDVYAIRFDAAGRPGTPQRLNDTGQNFPDGIGLIQIELTG